MYLDAFIHYNEVGQELSVSLEMRYLQAATCLGPPVCFAGGEKESEANRFLGFLVVTG